MKLKAHLTHKKMATTTQDTNRAKFLELRQQGKSVAEARNATY